MMSEKMTMVIAGANGFMGRYLSRYFLDKGWRVFGIARKTMGMAHGVEYLEWDGETLERSWADAIDGADVLINLAGRTVNCRYNDENKRQILDSRVNSTRVLGEAVAGCEEPPSVWMNASTATFMLGRGRRRILRVRGLLVMVLVGDSEGLRSCV